MATAKQKAASRMNLIKARAAKSAKAGRAQRFKKGDIVRVHGASNILGKKQGSYKAKILKRTKGGYLAQEMIWAGQTRVISHAEFAKRSRRKKG